jgi:CheY-like chemotaxis protein
MDGYQFYAAVRSQSPQHIPFLFISGQEATRLIVDPLCGVVGYLSKPFRISDLLEMIDHALAR